MIGPARALVSPRMGLKRYVEILSTYLTGAPISVDVTKYNGAFVIKTSREVAETDRLKIESKWSDYEIIWIIG